MKESLCGIWVDDQGSAHLAWRGEDGQYRETARECELFAWATEEVPAGGEIAEALDGAGPYSRLLKFRDAQEYRDTIYGDFRSQLEHVRPLENQWLLSHQERLFPGMRFAQLRRCQIGIEIAEVSDDAADPKRKEDRVMAISLWASDEAEPRTLRLEEDTDKAERQLLKDFGKTLQELNPDVLEGHSLLTFDLDFLHRRGRRFRLPSEWGRFGANARFRKSRLRAAERWIDYMRCDIPGRAVFDTRLAIQLYDVTTRDLQSYDLGEVAVYLGVTPAQEEAPVVGDAAPDARPSMEEALRETRGIADVLLPTYFAQTQNFPMLLQEIALRGSAQKVDLLLLEKYFHSRQALPEYPEVSTFEGAFTRSFETGVFQQVLHFDVASLYPSLLLHMGRNPSTDHLGIFIPLLEEMRTQRLEYKRRAREADTEELRREYNARQQAFKILINSFYGYLGFAGGRFADSDLAAEVTRRGRELLKALIEVFQAEGCTVLEADTDGIYLSAPEYWETPEKLLEKAKSVLPPGIDLEYDGSYPAMFCYKAKNYALYDGDKITVRGSALRSRGVEPFLQRLTESLLQYMLGVSAVSPDTVAEELRNEIEAGKAPVELLAKSEYLSMSPQAYRKKIDAGGKPRRAALEVALQVEPPPRMGERVSYFIVPREKGQTSDWQRARPLAAFDPIAQPYDPAYYLKKIKDWFKRYDTFLPDNAEPSQRELL